jgi:hypothetical protein
MCFGTYLPDYTASHPQTQHILWLSSEHRHVTHQFCIVLLAEADELKFKEENVTHFTKHTSAFFATLNLLPSAEIKWLLCCGTVA